MVFATSSPDGFIPNIPWDNDENGLAALVAAFEANEIEEKKNQKQPTRTRREQSPNNKKKRKLMSPDNDDLTIALPGRIPPPAPAVINKERQKIGQMVCQALVDKYDEDNRIRNTAKAYDPKVAEFELWCKTFYNNDAMLMYQVTRGKVESFLTYNLFREAKPRGKRKGVAKGAPQLDYERANQIIKIYQSVQVMKSKSSVLLIVLF